ncbi:roadblock/LC7 domain-containing protein [Deinococcus budaensis]|nr:roadblock/LC7 domain-containing protein [Deinococcus budaensis]
MTNAVYTPIVRALSGIVSERAAETMLRAALREQGLSPEAVTAAEMQRVLSGPLLVRLSGLLPEARARTELGRMAGQLQAQDPRAATLFAAAPAAAWDEAASGTLWTDPGWTEFGGAEAADLSADDFEFDDPEYATPLSERRYVLDSAAGQEALVRDLARMPGVQGVLVCRASGEVLHERALQGSASLGSVAAAAALLFRQRSLRLLAADLGGRTVCMRPLGAYCVAVVAGTGVNTGRLLAELGQVRAAT